MWIRGEASIFLVDFCVMRSELYGVGGDRIGNDVWVTKMTGREKNGGKAWA